MIRVKLNNKKLPRPFGKQIVSVTLRPDVETDTLATSSGYTVWSSLSLAIISSFLESTASWPAIKMNKTKWFKLNKLWKKAKMN